jgi:hypothetical protein
MAITCFLFSGAANAALPTWYTGKPYNDDTLLGKPQQIPGVVKGMFTDSGGEGVSYHDAPTLQAFGNNDYDEIGYGTNGQLDSSVNATHPTSHLAYIPCDNPNVNPPIVGEWNRYTVHVNTAGTYYVDFKQATGFAPPNLETITYYEGSSSRTDSVPNLPESVPPPGCPESWHAWIVNMAVDSVALDTGLQIVQIHFNLGSENFDWMRFRLQGGMETHVPALLRPQTGLMGLKTCLDGTKLTLSYRAGAAVRTKISLVDCSGRKVLSSIDEASELGDHSASVDVRNLRQGVYFVSIEQGGNRETKSVSITR